MNAEIIVAFITGLCSVMGVVITTYAGNRKFKEQMQINQAITNTKIEELTREVHEHNNFAKRVPAVEERLRGAERRVDFLEAKCSGCKKPEFF